MLKFALIAWMAAHGQVNKYIIDHDLSYEDCSFYVNQKIVDIHIERTTNQKLYFSGMYLTCEPEINK